MGGVGVTEVWMVRHTAVDVPAGMCYGRTDVPLRESFAREAEAVRRALDGVRFDEVWSSPRSRCTRLASECGCGDARLDPRLAELDFGEWEGRLFDEIDDPQLQIWYADYLHARPTGGETFDEQRARVSEFIDSLRAVRPQFAPDDTRRVLIFTHGGVMVAAGLHAGLFDEADAFSHVPPHGSILRLTL